MPVEEYKGFHIFVYYRGKTPHYRVWTKDFDEGIKKQNEEFKNALKRAGWTNDEDINWNYDSPEWNKKEREDT